jgi:nifR3 family TIM-barrel protein
LTSIASRSAARGNVSSAPCTPIPALTTARRSPPFHAAPASTAAASAASSRTSATNTAARPPAASTARAVSSSSSRRRATSATAQRRRPSSTATSRPIPDDAPVTRQPIEEIRSFTATSYPLRYTPPVLRFGSVAITPPLVLAPMAGITDRDFRLLIRRLGGCGLVSMEFISCEGLLRQRPGTLRMLHFVDEERPLAIQIYGSDPDRMGEAARAVEAMGADVCDVNMGCPANKVLKGCAGAALTGDLPLARRIVAAIRAAIRIPLTVKFRLGLREDRMTYLELGRICEGEGAQAVALHPRTAAQQFGGPANWRHIAQLKETLSIPVVGNGDVRQPEDVVRLFDETGCDAVMVGRAALTNPWVFSQAAALLDGRAYEPPTLVERYRLMRDHFDEVVVREDERSALHKLKTFTGWYTHGLPDGRQLRRQLSELASARAVLDAIDAFFAGKAAA